MRTLSKIATSSLLIGGALLVAACGHSDNTANADTNMSNMDTVDSSAGMTNDASALDASGNDAMGDMNGAAPADNASNAM
jgi:hypothetical protein